MDESLKKRLVGAAVLASLAVIFVPMLVDKRATPPQHQGLPRLLEQEPLEIKPRLIQEKIPAPQPLPAPTPLPVPEPVVSPPPGLAESPKPVAVIPKPPVEPVSVSPAAPAKPKPEPKVEPRPKPAAESKPKVPARAEHGNWVIQVGAFGKRDNAQRLVEKLRKAGLDTMDPERVMVRGKALYRVIVGPEIDRRRAEKLLPKIKQVSKLQGQLYAYP